MWPLGVPQVTTALLQKDEAGQGERQSVNLAWELPRNENCSAPMIDCVRSKQSFSSSPVTGRLKWALRLAARGSPSRAIVRYRRPPQAKGRIGDRARRVGGFWPVTGFKALCPSFLFCHGAGNVRLSSGRSGREGIFTRGHGLLRQGRKDLLPARAGNRGESDQLVENGIPLWGSQGHL